MDVSGLNGNAAMGAMGAMSKALQAQGIGGQIIGKTLNAMEQMKSEQQNSNIYRDTVMKEAGLGKGISVIV